MNVLELSQTAGNYAGAAKQASGILNDIFGSGGLFGHSQHYQILKNGEAQNEVNKQMAQWNMENVTKPVFEMENAEWDRRFQEQNTEWERQWEMQNEYNTPAAQVQRMREAGLNPAGMNMDSGGTAAPGSVGSPTVNEAASAFANPASIFDAMRAEAELKTANARVEQMHQQNRLTERDIEEKTINNKTLADLNAGRCALQWAEVETESSKQTLNRAQANQAKAMLKQIDSYSRYLDEQIPIFQQQFKNLKEQFWQIRAATRRENAQAEQTDQQTVNLRSQNTYQQALNKYVHLNQQWMIKEAMSRFNLNAAQAKAYLQEAANMAQDAEIKQWKFGNTVYKWGKYGQWEVDFEGDRARWRYQNADLFNNLEGAQINFEQQKNKINSMMYYWEKISNGLFRRADDFFGKVTSGSLLGGAGKSLMGSEGYQFFE